MEGVEMTEFNDDLMEEMSRRIADLEAQLKRRDMELFYPVDELETIGPRSRLNFIKINANFASLGDGFQMVNVGVVPNDMKGDSFRDAWIKVNENFAKLEEMINKGQSSLSGICALVEDYEKRHNSGCEEDGGDIQVYLYEVVADIKSAIGKA